MSSKSCIPALVSASLHFVAVLEIALAALMVKDNDIFCDVRPVVDHDFGATFPEALDDPHCRWTGSPVRLCSPTSAPNLGGIPGLPRLAVGDENAEAVTAAEA